MLPLTLFILRAYDYDMRYARLPLMIATYTLLLMSMFRRFIFAAACCLRFYAPPAALPLFCAIITITRARDERREHFHATPTPLPMLRHTGLRLIEAADAAMPFSSRQLDVTMPP